MRRLFTFGCSLTQFFYPTWADLLIWHLGESTDTSENWGKSGAGNQFIFTRLMEADSIFNFTKDDLIVIQWTSMYRDDRWIEGTGWHNAGNLFHGQLKHEPMTLNNFDYTDQYQWADQVHCVMRDCAIIKATEVFLKDKGCTYIKFQFADYYNDLSDKNSKLDYTKAIAISKVKDGAMRESLLKEVIEKSLSLSGIRQRVAEINQIVKQEDSLKSNLDNTYRLIKSSKIWDNTKKRRQLQKLLVQIEKLVGGE